MVIYERDIAVDMGTSNTLVYVHGKGLALREPTVVAVDKVKDKMLKIGEDAKKPSDAPRQTLSLSIP